MMDGRHGTSVDAWEAEKMEEKPGNSAEGSLRTQDQKPRQARLPAKQAG